MTVRAFDVCHEIILRSDDTWTSLDMEGIHDDFTFLVTSPRAFDSRANALLGSNKLLRVEQPCEIPQIQ